MPLLPLLLLCSLGADPSPPVTLAELVAASQARSPRATEPALLDERLALREASFDARFRPSFLVDGLVGYRTDVPSFGDGGLLPSPRKDQIGLTLGAEQLLYDGGRTRHERAIERAGTALETQSVETELYSLRRRVEDAYFEVLLAEAETRLLDVLIEDLGAQARRLETRVEAGAALPGDVAVLGADLAVQRQRRLESDAGRLAALAALRRLTGRALPAETRFEVPSVSLPSDPSTLLEQAERPELAELARRGELLEARRAAAGVGLEPTASAYAEVGGGRPPGQNFAERDWDTFYRLGVRLRWKPYDWGTAARDAAALELEKQLLERRRAAFLDDLGASVAARLEQISALEAVVAADAGIVALRERVTRRSEVQLTEGVITPTDYLVERNQEHRARLLAEQHRLLLARSRAQLATELNLPSTSEDPHP